MMMMRRPSGVATAALLGALIGGGGCSILMARDPVFLTPDEWTRAIRERGAAPAGIPSPLETTDEMRAFAKEVAGGGSMFDRLTRIQGTMFDRAMFTIDQESPETLTAAEAFQRRRGNCVSFTNLFLRSEE